MRTTARLLTTAALAVAATIGLDAQGAYAGDWESTLEVFPSTAPPGTTITVNTTACGPGGRGVGDASELGAGEFRVAPGTHKEVAVGQFTIPHHTRPGFYGISVTCRNGRTATGDVTVQHTGPRGHVRTGVGGSVGPDTAQIAAGVAVLAAAAVGGTLFLRRRASGAQGG
ncbi:hypothetical protein [Streptomyces sp. NPDC020681]|uniref:hypothetical protein n=1 Tax=Streptomyces sp. NPDC020681 TaxID=3365083 RepID=UPI003787B223